MRISSKIIVGYVLLLVAIVIIATIGWIYIHTMSQNTNTIGLNYAPSLNHLRQMQTHLAQMNGGESAILYINLSDTEFNQRAQNIDEARTNLEKQFTDYQPLVDEGWERDDNLVKIIAAKDAYFAAHLAYMEMERNFRRELTRIRAEQHQGAEVDNRFVVSRNPGLTKLQESAAHQTLVVEPGLTSALTKALDDAADYNQKMLDKNTAEAVHAGESARTIMASISLGALVIGITVAIFLIRNINGLLNRLIANLSSSSEQVASAAGQVSQSSQRMASGASEQAASLEETTASLQELSASTRQNADNARQADALAQEANRTAQSGENEANRIANEVAAHLANLTQAVADIKKSTEQTQQVVETIDEIAFQTNLLALNAAVEAARAGEAGMGFAVVADEVRNLAQRSTEEVKNTSELMKQAKISTERVLEVTATVEGYLKQAVGEAMVGSFKQVVGATEKVTHLMAEVSVASDEQAKGVEQINSAITEMDRVTQENAASAEQSAAASEELNAQADEMLHSVVDLRRAVSGIGAAAVPNSETQPSARATTIRPTLAPHRSSHGLTMHASGHGAPHEHVLPLTDNEAASAHVGDAHKRS
jgi:methyl-accepting chemotaxis protein